MKKYEGERFNSVWDWSTWLLLALVAACVLWPLLIDKSDGMLPVAICVVVLIFVVVMFLGVYYRIDGNNLVVYTAFRPKTVPIDKIKSIAPTKSVLSAPATSLTQRLAITFTDRSVLKSSDPLVISPVRQQEFIKRLLAVNPNISVE